MVIEVKWLLTFLICCGVIIICVMFILMNKARKLWLRMQKIENKLIKLESLITNFSNLCGLYIKDLLSKKPKW